MMYVCTTDTSYPLLQSRFGPSRNILHQKLFKVMVAISSVHFSSVYILNSTVNNSRMLTIHAKTRPKKYKTCYRKLIHLDRRLKDESGVDEIIVKK